MTQDPSVDRVATDPVILLCAEAAAEREARERRAEEVSEERWVEFIKYVQNGSSEYFLAT